MKSQHGQKYVIIGRIASPVGKVPLVQTISIIDSGPVRLDWLQHIRTKNEGRYDQGT